MAEREGLDRDLALAKSALGAPPGARARVRARLAAAAPLAPVMPGGARAFARALAWVSLGLCAGYWLGFHRIGAPLVEPARPAHETPAQGVHVTAARPPTSGANPTTLEAARAPAESGRRTNDASALANDQVERATHDETAVKAVAAAAPAGSRGNPAPRRQAGAVRAPRKENTLGAEIALLERVERAIRAGEGKLALVLIDQLEREFPTSPLYEERAAARVLARCTEARSAGPAERAAARARADQFLAHGSSVYAERVRELCAVGDQN